MVLDIWNGLWKIMLSLFDEHFQLEDTAGTFSSSEELLYIISLIFALLPFLHLELWLFLD